MVQTPDAEFVETNRHAASIPSLGCRARDCGVPAHPIRGDPMNVQACPWPVALALALGLTLSGCTIGTPASGDTPSSVDRKEKRKHQAAKKRTARAAAAPKPKPKPAKKKAAPKQVWVCSWAPTFDDDGHNDVLCDNGIASERPRLREWDDHVERREIMVSARAYARERNRG